MPDTSPVPADVPAPAAARALRLLLAEDDFPTRSVLARLLEGKGHTVVAVDTVEEAIAAGQRERFDVLISDLGLPDGSGLQIMEALRDGGVRGIALSGYNSDEDLRRSREAGFARHMVKPVDFAALVAAVEELARS